jgi:diphosphate-dependent phosphofructokinase
LLAQRTLEITNEVLASYKNQGGYDMLGRTKDQIRTTEQVNGAMASCQALKLDALVIIGGMLCFLIYLLRFWYSVHLLIKFSIFIL